MDCILVTGGAGFIGSNFVRSLLKSRSDVHVTNLDKLTYAGNLANTDDFKTNKRYEFVRGDICDAALVTKLVAQSNLVIHFAAESHVDRSIASGENFATSNVLGTQTLLEAGKKSNLKKFIYFSTDEVYGSRRSGSFVETDPLNPTSPYSASKAAGDLLAMSYWKTHQVPVTIIRSSNNFGPYQFPEKVMPLFITNLIEGKKVPLYGKGENIRDWVYVEDCVRATDFILNKGAVGEIYNIAGRHEMSNIDLARAMLEVFGKNEDSIEYVQDRLAHDFRYSVSMKKLERLGFNITVNFKECLNRTVDWYRQNESWWKPLKKDAFTVK
jgi:dTDP-glucose 4,6-dehydratase